MKRHDETVHGDIRAYFCEKCGISFGQKDKFQKHSCSREIVKLNHMEKLVQDSNLEKTEITDDVILKCSKCDKSFSRQRNLVDHIMIVHENIRPFKCEICDKAHGKKSELTKHVKIFHEGIKPLYCDECNKGYNGKKDLNQHIFKVHKEIQPIQA